LFWGRPDHHGLGRSNPAGWGKGEISGADGGLRNFSVIFHEFVVEKSSHSTPCCIFEVFWYTDPGKCQKRLRKGWSLFKNIANAVNLVD
jgi:hypothetical protein